MIDKIKVKDTLYDIQDTEAREELSNKVDKVNGKNLSTNDFTNEYKQKLDGLTNYDDTEIKQKLETKANKILVENSDETTLEIEPNKYYQFGEVTELNITLKEPTDTTILNEYMFEFVSGETATTLTLPDTNIWGNDNELTVETNKRYEINIVDNVALWCAVDMEVNE